MPPTSEKCVEKGLPVPDSTIQEEPKKYARYFKWWPQAKGYLKLVLLLAICFFYTSTHELKRFMGLNLGVSAPICPQPGELAPVRWATLWKEMNEKIGSADFRTDVLEAFSGAIQIKTESYDNMKPVGEDDRWLVFGSFHDYLHDTFPMIHSTLNLTKVNTYGLYYEWKGKAESLKPILLLAHQDVVPVDANTLDEWKYPPYSGDYSDNRRIWGRGAIDNKSGVIGIMSAIEALIKGGFEPTRTIILSFGFDEESGGIYGAAHLSEHLQSLYGEKSIAMIVDEGFGYGIKYDSVIAFPGIAEKGSLNVKVEVRSPGGHSSSPPAHTSIGFLAAMLVQYENNPFKPNFVRSQPLYGAFQCVGEHASGVPNDLRALIKMSETSDWALQELEKIVDKTPVIDILVKTTQAITVIEGGVKFNALPEQAWAVINHRIDVLSSLEEVMQRDTDLLKDLAVKFNLTYTAFDQSISNGSDSSTLDVTWATERKGLKPAPITPVGTDAAAYQLLAGTIKSVYNAGPGSRPGGKDVVIAPGLMSGNTDTRFYWNLTDNIFRYSHLDVMAAGSCASGIHTVNECNSIDGFFEQVRFFTGLILNADEATNL